MRRSGRWCPLLAWILSGVCTSLKLRGIELFRLTASIFDCRRMGTRSATCPLFDHRFGAQVRRKSHARYAREIQLASLPFLTVFACHTVRTILGNPRFDSKGFARDHMEGRYSIVSFLRGYDIFRAIPLDVMADSEGKGKLVRKPSSSSFSLNSATDSRPSVCSLVRCAYLSLDPVLVGWGKTVDSFFHRG